MASINLLNLNVDTLFEQLSVGEIDVIHKKIQEVVENKKEELRTMVGERYRDLLKAADTITAMQESSKALITQVEQIRVTCRNLNEQQLLGFKTETDSATELRTRNCNKQLNNYFSTMIQIKLLTSLPEMIWSQLDREHYYVATELFIFSRHISTGLQLDSNNPLMQKLPVAKKQWEILKPFYATIKQQVLRALERENLVAELAVDCVLALLQLDRCSVESAIKIFLNLRSAAYMHCLTSDEGRVKERILSSLKVLNETLDMLTRCFMDNGLLYKKLNDLRDPNAPPTIACMSSDDLQFVHLLPDIITNFKPTFGAETHKTDSTSSSLDIFVAETKRIADNHLKLLFDLVSNMNTIQEIKSEANIMKTKINLTTLAQQYNLRNCHDFYEERYVPLINQRIRNIINASWSNSTKVTFSSLKSALEKENILNRPKVNIWQEFPDDLPNSLAQALNEDMKVKKLLMKSKGYNNVVIQIVTEFDESLLAIIKEINVLLDEPTTKVEDKLALVDFLKETSQHHITEFISEIKKLQLEFSHRLALLFIIRFCCSLVELCPHLKKCFCHASSWHELLGDSSNKSSLEHWQRICGLLEDEVFQMWLHLVDGLLKELTCNQYLAEVTTSCIILEDFTNWELITLEQNDDQDMPVQSSFRVPIQPRISLQSYLHLFITSLKSFVPETVPDRVLNALNHKLLESLLNYYQDLLKNQDGSNRVIEPNVALQFYFDLKFLQNSFINNREQKQQFSALQSVCKQSIDPFDFELFSPQLITNVKKAVSRFSCLLGVLTPVAVQAVQNVGGLVQEKNPNVLSLCSSGATSLWFPLLPVVHNTNDNLAAGSLRVDSKPESGSGSEKNTPTRRSTSSSSSTRRNESKTKSGAASFFGAMSQEWFR